MVPSDDRPVSVKRPIFILIPRYEGTPHIPQGLSVLGTEFVKASRSISYNQQLLSLARNRGMPLSGIETHGNTWLIHKIPPFQMQPGLDLTHHFIRSSILRTKPFVLHPQPSPTSHNWNHNIPDPLLVMTIPVWEMFRIPHQSHCTKRI